MYYEAKKTTHETWQWPKYYLHLNPKADFVEFL